MVSLNCEDILLWLVFRHLIPLKHLVPSKREAIRQADLHGRAADKLLSLTPICCQEATSAYLEQMHSRQPSNHQRMPAGSGQSGVVGTASNVSFNYSLS